VASLDTMHKEPEPVQRIQKRNRQTKTKGKGIRAMTIVLWLVLIVFNLILIYKYLEEDFKSKGVKRMNEKERNYILVEYINDLRDLVNGDINNMSKRIRDLEQNVTDLTTIVESLVPKQEEEQKYCYQCKNCEVDLIDKGVKCSKLNFGSNSIMKTTYACAHSFEPHNEGYIEFILGQLVQDWYKEEE